MRKVGVVVLDQVNRSCATQLAALFVISLAGCGDRIDAQHEPTPSLATAASVAISASTEPRAAPSGGVPPAPSSAPSSRPPVAPVPLPPTPPEIVVPSSVSRAGTRRPFVLLLHGFSGSGSAIARHVGLAALAERRSFTWSAPDGALDRSKRRHWNTGPSCCDFDRLGVDHVGALRAVIDAAKKHPSIDPARIYVAGYSNGGFMAERLACDVPGIAGVLDVAGGAPADVGACAAPPIGALVHVHGDRDPTVRIEGGRVLGRTDVAPHPAAAESVAAWSRRAGCGIAQTAGTLDLEASLDGEETTRSRLGGCAGAFEMLTVAGGGHDVAGSPAAFARLLTILLPEDS